jgi:O-antigen/teichoic acid export membrane protein
MALIGAHIHAGAGFFLWAYVAASGFATVYFIVVLLSTRILAPRWQLELDLFRHWIRAGIPLAITYLLTTVYFKLDVPILQHYRTYAEVGWYTFAYRPFEALLFIPATLRTVVFPVLSIYYRDAPNRVLASAEKLFKGLAIIGWPITVGLFLLAPQFIDLLTSQYPQSAASLRILAIAVVFMFVDNTFPAVLNAIDRQKMYAYVALSGLVINLGLNLILIPRFGYIGASWATVATEIGLVLTGWVALRGALGPLHVVRSCWRPFVAGVVMGLFVWLINPHGRLALLAVTAAAAVLYAVMLVVLRTADDEERSIIRRTLRMRGSPPSAPQ